MSTADSPSTARRDWKLLLPSIGIAALYAVVITTWGQPGGASVTQLRKDREAAQAAAVTQAEVSRLTKERDDLTKQAAEWRTKLKATRGEAELLGRKGNLGNKSMELHRPTVRL